MPKFTLITLNCFGVPTPFTAQRLRTLGQELNRQGADVVCLQEVQAHAYRRLLIHTCTAYPAHAYEPFFHAPKGGLLTLSRHTFIESRFMLYRERGLWYTPALADWVLHKGILYTRMQVEGVPVMILNTHLTANYSGNWARQNRYARHEWEQLQQLAELVRAQPPECLVVVAGDFNVPRGSWLADEFLSLSGLTDPLAGDTQPTFRPMPGLPARYAAAIDFVLVRAPQAVGLNPATNTLRLESHLCFQEKYTLASGTQAHLSDHYGIALEVSWGSF